MSLSRRSMWGAFALSNVTEPEKERSIRERFFSPESADRWTGMRTAILLRREVKGQPCQIREVAAESVMRSFDRVQLRLQANQSGYFYVAVEDRDGNNRLLYPVGEDRNRGRCDAFQPTAAPSLNWFRVDNEPGVEPILIVFSRRPVERLESLAKKTDAVLTSREMRRLVAGQGAAHQESELEESRNGSIPMLISIAAFENDDDLLIERVSLAHRPARTH